MAGYSTASWGSPVNGFASGSDDGFAVKLDSGGALTWNTFLDGRSTDIVYAESGHACGVGSSG